MIVSGTNISMTRGDSGTLIVSLSGDQGLTDGDRIELTVRLTPTSPERVIHKTVTEFEEGKAVIAFAPEDTGKLIFRSYVYDVQLARANGDVYTIIKPSRFEITPEVTY